MTNYKLIKDFGIAKKGDILTYNEHSNSYSIQHTMDNDTFFTSSYMEINPDAINTFIEEGVLIPIDTDEKAAKGKTIKEVTEYICSLLNQYAHDYEELLKEFEAGNVQPCVKVEAETVYFNLTKVLKSILKYIDE